MHKKIGMSPRRPCNFHKALLHQSAFHQPQGILTGKYIEEILKDSRAEKDAKAKAWCYDPYMGTEEKKARTVKILKGLMEIAEGVGCSLPALLLPGPRKITMFQLA